MNATTYGLSTEVISELGSLARLPRQAAERTVAAMLRSSNCIDNTRTSMLQKNALIA